MHAGGRPDISDIKRMEAGESEFKVILDYTATLRTDWIQASHAKTIQRSWYDGSAVKGAYDQAVDLSTVPGCTQREERTSPQHLSSTSTHK